MSDVEDDRKPLSILKPFVDVNDDKDSFHLRYYAGHMGRFGHEFLEFEIKLKDDGTEGHIMYENSTNYRREDAIRKEFFVSASVVRQIKKIVADSEIMRETHDKWPTKNRDGKQQLSIRSGRHNVSFETCKIGSLTDVKKSDDPDGLRVFYFVVQDLKALIFSLISLHFKIKPI